MVGWKRLQSSVLYADVEALLTLETKFDNQPFAENSPRVQLGNVYFVNHCDYPYELVSHTARQHTNVAGRTKTRVYILRKAIRERTSPLGY
jgi:hypothetical protein